MSADKLDRLDYYTLLRVEDDATSDAIRAAFHAFALRYHPDRFSGAPAKRVDRASEIFRRGAEGYRVLMNPQTRQLYDRELKTGKLRLQADDERQAARPSSSNRLTVRSARARPFASKALVAYRSGDFKTAKLNLKMALLHEPDNALLQARLADVEEKLQSS